MVFAPFLKRCLPKTKERHLLPFASAQAYQSIRCPPTDAGCKCAARSESLLGAHAIIGNVLLQLNFEFPTDLCKTFLLAEDV